MYSIRRIRLTKAVGIIDKISLENKILNQETTISQYEFNTWPQNMRMFFEDRRNSDASDPEKALNYLLNEQELILNLVDFCNLIQTKREYFPQDSWWNQAPTLVLQDKISDKISNETELKKENLNISETYTPLSETDNNSAKNSISYFGSTLCVLYIALDEITHICKNSDKINVFEILR